jgi:hypothetical protein
MAHVFKFDHVSKDSKGRNLNVSTYSHYLVPKGQFDVYEKRHLNRYYGIHKGIVSKNQALQDKTSMTHYDSK